MLAETSAFNRMEISRVIRTAHQRAGRDMLESFFARDLTVKIELLRRDELDHRQMIRRRPEILPHGQDLAANFAQIVHRLENLRLCLTQAKHDAALGHRFWRKLFGPS